MHNSLYTLSICIPTYNRPYHLSNCLASILKARYFTTQDFQVCISDNSQDCLSQQVVEVYKDRLNIKYHRNKCNIGIPRNFLKVVSLSDAQFVWLLGDDDLLLHDSLERIHALINNNQNVDFFYVNSYHLNTEYLDSYPHPFDIENLPSSMEPFSSYTLDGQLPFLKLINPNISFDFLGGMFLSVFRRENWINSVSSLDHEAIYSDLTFSHFDNTFPHLKIFSYGFASSVAYFNSSPLNVCLTGAREWAPLGPLVMSIRLVQALELYRRNGLPLLQYYRCRNFALRNFFSDFLQILCFKRFSNFKLPLGRIFFSNIFYPNFYLSPFYFFARKTKILFSRLTSS